MNFNSILSNIGAFVSGKKRQANIKDNFNRDKSFFFPILRNFNDGDIFIKKSVNFPLGDDIGIFIVKRTQNDRQHFVLDYILHVHLEQYGISETKIKALAKENLKENQIKIEGIEDPETKDTMVRITSPFGWVGGILLDKKLIDSIEQKLGGNIVIGVINSGLLLITTPNSSYEKQFETITKSIDYTETVPLQSASYQWKNGALIFKKFLIQKT